VSLNLADGDALVLATEGALKASSQGAGPDETAFLKTVLAAAKHGASGLAERIVAAVAGKSKDGAVAAQDLTVVTAVRTGAS
jgi:hypothetical protein